MGFNAKRGDRKKVKFLPAWMQVSGCEQKAVAFIRVHSRSIAEKINMVTK